MYIYKIYFLDTFKKEWLYPWGNYSNKTRSYYWVIMQGEVSLSDCSPFIDGSSSFVITSHSVTDLKGTSLRCPGCRQGHCRALAP